jgi:hypothetical protein
MKKLLATVVLAWLTTAGSASPALADASPPAETAGVLQCNALASTDFSNVRDAPTQVTETKRIEASDGTPAYCRVRGYVTRSVGFELDLPESNWSGKFFESGCGGFCGVVRANCSDKLRKGYACLASDMGHRGTGSDGLWAYNNIQAKIDWGYRATHVVTVAGKQITARYYGREPSHSYFMGGSTGGRQALVEAQRFPWDFDGIIAIAPAPSHTGVVMNMLWAILAGQGEENKPLFKQTDLQLVHDAVVAACDMNDGVKDGLIGDPRLCKFDPVELLCKSGQGSNCLTRAQVDAVRKIYSGPKDSKGEKLDHGGYLPGSEANWVRLYFGSDEHAPQWLDETVNMFRYVAFPADPGPAWKPTDFDWDRDYKRLAIMEALYSGSNPDLRQFKAAGGKLIVSEGWADECIGPLNVVDYYETVEKLMGGRAATQAFFRLFMLPGVHHAGGGEGADEIDYLSYLEAWVEKNEAPDEMIASHVDVDQFNSTHGRPGEDTEKLMRELEKFRADPKNVKFTRPAYPFPIRAEYKGSGDANDAANFRPVRSP